MSPAPIIPAFVVMHSQWLTRLICIGLEVNFGIAAACLPAIYPGYKALSHRITSYRSSRRSSYPKSEKSLLPPSVAPAVVNSMPSDGKSAAPLPTAHRPRGIHEEEATGVTRTGDFLLGKSSETVDLDLELGTSFRVDNRTSGLYKHRE